MIDYTARGRPGSDPAASPMLSARVMNVHFCASVWIDHREAKILHFSATEADRPVIRPHDPARRVRREASLTGSGDAPADQSFLEQVARAITDAGTILMTGPANAKSELVAHVTHRHPDLARRVAGVETIDHPGSGALIALARINFGAADRPARQFEDVTS